MIERPEAGEADALSWVLRAIRLAGALQFCIAPAGEWRTGPRGSLRDLLARPSDAIPFHVVVEGRCWLEIDGRRIPLDPGDVVAFPFASAHDLGAGAGAGLAEINPVVDLPPRPWRHTPTLAYGDGGARVRILCGVVECDAASFPPLRAALPPLLHARAAEAGGWLAATVAQMAAEVDRPRAGGVSMLERLSEVLFIELLRRLIAAAPPGGRGWLVALGDPGLARCLAAIHAEPGRDWTVDAMAGAAHMSRSRFCARFAEILGTAPMRYLRDWRLTLARSELGAGARPIAEIAHEAGYGAEAAFNRAFARAFGVPPAAWRAAARGVRGARGDAAL